METQTPDLVKQAGTKGARGRKDQGTEAVIKLGVVKERIDNLVKLYNAAATAKDDFSSAVKAVAEKAGLLSTVVNKFVAARAGENFEESKAKAQQLALVFEEVGE